MKRRPGFYTATEDSLSRVSWSMRNYRFRGITEESCGRRFFYCLKYGVKSHLERSKSDSRVPESQYLHSLIGRIQYVLLINPEDQWFKEAEQKLLAVLGRKSE
uniref:hypothetical protein n=1 Tax=Clostridium sp. NkU-1 TaxID=1095009 RepID=UPI003260FDB0